jgi:hypothetical protein
MSRLRSAFVCRYHYQVYRRHVYDCEHVCPARGMGRRAVWPLQRVSACNFPDSGLCVCVCVCVCARVCFVFSFLFFSFLSPHCRHQRGFFRHSPIVGKHITRSLTHSHSLTHPLSLTLTLTLYHSLSNFLTRQFEYYGSEDDLLPPLERKRVGHRLFSSILYWLVFPVLPIGLALYFPRSVLLTNSIKPLCQVFSHLPQLKVGSTHGISICSGTCSVLLCPVLLRAIFVESFFFFFFGVFFHNTYYCWSFSLSLLLFLFLPV